MLSKVESTVKFTQHGICAIKIKITTNFPDSIEIANVIRELAVTPSSNFIPMYKQEAHCEVGGTPHCINDVPPNEKHVSLVAC